MKWLKKWSYLILLVCGGLVYLFCVDDWQVYAKPLAQAKNWCIEFNEKNNVLAIVGSLLWGDMGSVGGEAAEDRENHKEDAVAESQEGLSGDGLLADGTGIGEQGQTDGWVGTGAAEQSGSSGATGQEEHPGKSGEENQDIQGDMPDEAGQDGTQGKPGGKPELEVAFGDGKEPVYMTVEDDYFSDAVFIGDSRTVGMFEYGGLEEITTFYATEGMSVYKFYESKIVEVPGEKEKLTVEEALQENSFSKVYLMLGINEMGTGTTETFIQKYSEVVDRIQELQPDAIIYLQSIMKVSSRRSAKGDYIHNEGIVERNAEIEKLADNEKIFYLDVNPLICDESGAMNGDYTYDGVHLKAKYIEIWRDFLKQHAIAPSNNF